MTYEEKYKEALKKAKSMIDDLRKGEDILAVSGLESMFPELKESEDEMVEKIRKDIISYLNNRKITSIAESSATERWIAWLEKQGEQNYKIIKGKNYFCVKTHNYAGVEWIKGVKYYASDNNTLVNKGCEYYCPEYSKEEHNNLFEEVKYDGCGCVENKMSVNKVEPKFHEGDWIVQGCNILKIRCVGNEYYCFETVGGYVDDMLVSEIDSLYHLWTIQDAKDGDVLAYVTDEEDLWIMIYWSLYEPYEGHVHYHALLVNDNFSDNGTCCICIENLKPATKEQRDLLFQKMKEAGYKWDEEKKELKRIEQVDGFDAELKETEDEKTCKWIIAYLTARQEQIEKAAENFAGVNYDIEEEADSFYHHVQKEAFNAGAEWADEHPDLYKSVERGREYLIDKFCEFMQSCEGYVVSGEKCNYDNFMKFMEEQELQEKN